MNDEWKTECVSIHHSYFRIAIGVRVARGFRVIAVALILACSARRRPGAGAAAGDGRGSRRRGPGRARNPLAQLVQHRPRRWRVDDPDLVLLGADAGVRVRKGDRLAAGSRDSAAVRQTVFTPIASRTARSNDGAGFVRRKQKPGGRGLCRRRAQMGPAGRGSGTSRAGCRRTRRARPAPLCAGVQRHRHHQPAAGFVGHCAGHDHGL